MVLPVVLGVLERWRIRRHLRSVESELRRRLLSGLSPDLLRARRRNLERLHEYWTHGQFPRNSYVRGRRIPILRDASGTACAVAYLVDRDGGGHVVDSLARIDNHVRVRDVRDGPLLGWLRGSGFTQEEAARIQPSYSPSLDFVAATAAILASLGPFKAFLGAIGDRWSLTRGRSAHILLGFAALFASLGLGLLSFELFQPGWWSDPYAVAVRASLLVAFAIALIPLELGAYAIFETLQPKGLWRRAATRAYLGLANGAVAAVAAGVFSLALLPLFSP